MIQIDDTLISSDLIERFFHCDLAQCGGACCVEGESGAPLEREEYDTLQKLLPAVWDDLSSEAKTVINTRGIGRVDAGNDLVTSLVEGKHCVFTCRGTTAGGCACAIEKAHREGRTGFMKPVSCHLYPVRVKQYRYYRAVNYHRWKVCRAAEILGERKGVPLYRFLREPLIRKFGESWYEALDTCAREYFKL
jgi:hypothetical protein